MNDYRKPVTPVDPVPLTIQQNYEAQLVAAIKKISDSYAELALAFTTFVIVEPTPVQMTELRKALGYEAPGADFIEWQKDCERLAEMLRVALDSRPNFGGKHQSLENLDDIVSIVKDAMP